nr:hypothetical protein Iba_chr13cCG17670 [Ipomoea batatas]GMD78927.1 hypothetical protein Iba_chr13cCG17680 [Ipomoea batatas]
MGPENEFSDKLSSTSLLSFIIEAGIGPLKWQPVRSIWDSSLRFPMDSGKFPENIVPQSSWYLEYFVRDCSTEAATYEAQNSEIGEILEEVWKWSREVDPIKPNNRK